MEVVESVGLTQAQCIDADAQTWLNPAGGALGTNRHNIAGLVLRLIIKHKQLACGKCGETHGHLTAARLTSIHLDHREEKKHAPAHCSRMHIADAITEYAKCKSACSGCHDQATPWNLNKNKQSDKKLLTLQQK